MTRELLGTRSLWMRGCRLGLLTAPFPAKQNCDEDQDESADCEDEDPDVSFVDLIVLVGVLVAIVSEYNA